MKYLRLKFIQQKNRPATCILTDIGIAGFVIEDPQDFSELLEKKNSYDWDYVDESLMDLAHIETNITFYLDVNEEGNSKLQEVKRQIEKLKERTVPSSSFSPFGKVDFGSLY